MEIFYLAIAIVAALIVALLIAFRVVMSERKEVLIQQEIEKIKRGAK